MPKVKRYLPLSSLDIDVKGKYLGIYVKRYLPRYLPLGVFNFYQQSYYPFWCEFSQNFVKFRRFANRENVKTFQ